MAVLAAIHADPLGLLVAFGAGMLSFLSPCVLPLVPAYLSMVSGLSAAELERPATGSPDRRASPVAVAAGPNGRPVRMAVAGCRPRVHGVPSPAVTGVPTPAAARMPRRRSRPSPADLRRQRSRLLRGILAFIAGFTVIFTILGASASAARAAVPHPSA